MNIRKYYNTIDRLKTHDIASRLVITIQAEFVSIHFHDSASHSQSDSFYYETNKELTAIINAILFRHRKQLHKI